MADVNKEIALKVTTDLGQTNQQFKNAQQELEETRKKLVDLALAGKQGTAEFAALEKRAGSIQDAIGDVNRRVNTLANDTPKLQLLTEAAQGIAGGFALAQGAAALFGDENEEVQQAILKTQGAMTLLNGVQQVANTLNKDSALSMALQSGAQRVLQLEVVKSTLALRGWSAALAATGIGAAIVAIGFLVAAFASASSESDELTESLERQKEEQARLKREIELTTQARLLEIQIMKTLGATEKEIALARLALLSEQTRAQQALIDTEKRNIELLEGFANTAALERRKLILKEKQFALDQLNAQVLEQLRIIQEFDAKVVQSSEKRLGNIEQVGRRGIEQVERQTEESERLQLEANARVFNAENEKQQRIAELRAFYAEQRKQDERRLEESTIMLAKGTFQAIADLSAFFAGESEEGQKRAFAFQKAAAIAQTLIETFSAAQGAYRSQLAIPDPSAPVRAAIAASIAVAGGLARVAAIRRTSFNSASTSAAPQAVRPAGISGGTPPPQGFNPNTSTPIVPPQVQPQGQTQGAQRVFVLERDITNVGRRVASVERFATFG